MEHLKGYICELSYKMYFLNDILVFWDEILKKKQKQKKTQSQATTILLYLRLGCPSLYSLFEKT